jgi:DNA-directed RNA polymerase specialized sigma24 family protein
VSPGSTAPSDTAVLPAVTDDATLVYGAAAGNIEALGAIYDRYAGRLLGFCQSLLSREADAAIALRAVFVTASSRIHELPDPILLRAWLFAIARNECVNVRSAHDFTEQPPLPVDGLDDDDIELGALLANVDDGVPYDERLLLELADRQELSEAEVAAAIGVPRPDAPGLIDQARRQSHGRLPSTGRAFAAEMAGLRTGILAAIIAGDTSSVAPPVDARWLGVWPPADTAFTTAPAPSRRRWGAPIAVLVVLLIAIGAAIGLVSVFSGSGHSVAQVNVAEPAPPSSSVAAATDPTSAAGTTGITGTAGAAVPTVAAPPAPAIASSPAASSTAPSNATSPPGSFTVYVDTDQHPVTIRSGSASAGCAASTSCAFLVPGNAVVTVSDSLRLIPDRFSAPASCTGQLSGSCTFTVTSNIHVVLTTPTLSTPTKRNH